jgi:tyrosyl-tRNA synthetase
MHPDEALQLLRSGAAHIISEAELREKLALGRPLRVKLGADPTSPDLHLGHAVVLRKLRQFQDLGHQAILIIGDFTAMIGDPSGRSVTRPQLSREQVLANAESYREQAFKVLDPARTNIVYNGEWFAKDGFRRNHPLNSRVTLQQMLQREDFRERVDQQQPIHAHEIQYPIMQGWDSVMVEAGRRARRNRSALQHSRRPRFPEAGGNGTAGRLAFADPRGARWREEDEQEPRELHRRE